MMAGALAFLTSTHPEAEELRRQYVFKVGGGGWHRPYRLHQTLNADFSAPGCLVEQHPAPYRQRVHLHTCWVVLGVGVGGAGHAAKAGKNRHSMSAATLQPFVRSLHLTP